MIDATVTHTATAVFIHQRFAVVVLVYALLMALWGFGLFLFKRPPSGGYLGALVLMAVVGIAQDVIGLALLALGHRPGGNLHYLYGLVVALTLPAAYTYSARGTARRDSLIFGIASLFLLGIAIRATMTGSP
ncbi:MAG: hypothetical protein ACRDFS_08360 [Chloroflexota bacterium]